MKAAVRYYSQTGNTKRVAEAIAEALGVEAKDTGCPLPEETEVVFLCNSVYWAGIDKNVKTFVRENAPKIGMLVNVSTAALIESTYGQMKKVAAQNGIRISDKEFHCRGKFSALHAGHPDEADLKAAVDFAKGLAR